MQNRFLSRFILEIQFTVSFQSDFLFCIRCNSEYFATIARISYQLANLLQDLSAIQQYFDLNAIQKTIMDLIQPSPTRRERVAEREEDLLIKDEFGFKKVIIAITEYSSIYAIHSSGGRVLWRQYVPDVELQQVYVIKKAIHYPPEVVIVGTNTKVLNGMSDLLSL